MLGMRTVARDDGALADEAVMKRKDVPALLKQLLALTPLAEAAAIAPAIEEKPLLSSPELSSPKGGSASQRNRSADLASPAAERVPGSKPSR